MQINEEVRKEMEYLILHDAKLKYCQLCKNNYGECIDIAINVFKLPYYSMSEKKLDKEYDNYSLPAIQAKKGKDLILENKILDKAIKAKITIPYVYLRKAKLLKADKMYEESIDICNKWLNFEMWKIPNAASSTIDIIKVKEICEKHII